MNSRIFLRVSFLLAVISVSFSVSAQVTASFSATPVSGCSPLIVRFTDESTGTPTQWKWDLGNGTISFLQNPAATYFSPGKYTIKLVVKNAGGADSIEKTDYIEVFAKPVVKFSASDTTGCYPLPVQFTDASASGSGNITSWLWDFGDGSTSTLQNPSHVYTSARNFSVTLQVRNSSGCISTFTRQSMIQISTGVLAQFTNDNPRTCTAPVTINFQNQSTGTGAVTYLWDLGDGNTSDLLSPSHTYTSNGTYTVKLIVTNSNGCADTITKPNAVTVGSVNAAFTSAASVCQNSNLQFTNTSTPPPASVTWTFGDGNTSSTVSPLKAYAAAGTYAVKMVANFGACSDSVTKTVTVLPKPTAAFTTTDTANCKAPFTVNFTSQSAGAVSYQWDFGDNTTSTLANPSHTYSSFGNFTVTLFVTGANGCGDTLIKANYIRIQKPRATITNIPDSGCVPFKKTFDLTVTTTDPVTSYLWDFGDGNSSNAAAPTNTYSLEGVYNISLIILTANGCTDTAKVTRGIITNNKPAANFSAVPTSTCAKTNVVFSDLSTGGPTKWLWDFGDSTTASIQNPIHQYLDTGYFDIKLTIWKGGCMDTVTIPRYIHINPPVAKFNVRNDCKKPFERVFTDQSIGADEWHWDFGDGTSSTLQSPVHVYTGTGTFAVTLLVVNNTYGCDFTTTKQVQIVNAKAQFTATDTVVCKGANVRFNTGLSLTDISSLNWNFGDGSASINSPRSQNYMEHIYSRAGRFNVRLIATDILGCADTLLKTSYISVNGPTANFSPAVSGACSNNAVVFNDATVTDGTHPIQQWEWNYGDNSSEILNAPPFQHVYTTPGAYIVKLKVTDSKGCVDSSKLSTALIISKPKANFTSVDTFSCPGKPVHFVSQSTGPTLTYHWNFGDNSTAAVQNPAHIYSSNGTYTVKLTITDLYGCTDSIIKTSYITITSPASFFVMSDSVSNCPPLVVNFTGQATNGINIKWDFGDSTSSVEPNPTHFYNYPGTYFASFTVTGQGGCTSVYQRRIVIKGPEGQFNYTPLKGCSPVNVGFAASTNGRNTFVWDFNDGNTISTNDSILTHTYTYPGKYIPKMILIDQTGCQVPIIGSDTIVVSSVAAKFGFSNKLLCDSGIISFSDSSAVTNDTIASYQWNFGDGGLSASRNPVHTYASAGTYYPTLVAVTQLGCADTLRTAVPVKVVASPQVGIASTANGCAPLTVTFNSQLVVPDTSVVSWQWDLANGNTSNIATPLAQKYTIARQYIITLIGTNSSGCRDTATKTIEAYAIPTVSAGTDFTLCKGSSRSLQATGAVSYTWSPATALDCTNCVSPTTTTGNNISYVVKGTSAQGCSATDTIAVTVKTKLVLTHSSSDSVCRGSSKKLTAGGASTYSWTPASNLSDPNIAEPVATPDTSTIYRVIGGDDVGCFKDTGYISIRVNPLPTVEAGLDKTLNVGQTIDLIPEISPDVTWVNWSPTTGLFRNVYPGITVKPVENTEYTVDVKNKGGCAARDRVTVFVICNGANIFIPNTFSPNGDGTNDVFYPRGTGVFKIKSLRLYTRWGELIFERSNFDANNPSYGWDGTNKGMQVNSDVFIYTLEVICDNGSVLTHRGNIALIK